MCGSLFFGRIITILFSGVCTLFLTISAIVPSRGSTFFSLRLVGVVSRRWVWLVGVVGIYGCGYWVWF